jgi:hypothetical protein
MADIVEEGENVHCPIAVQEGGYEKFPPTRNVSMVACDI